MSLGRGIWRGLALTLLALAAVSAGAAGQINPEEITAPFNQADGMLLRGTIVTMDAAGSILKSGNVLVRNGRIVAVWQGSRVPAGVSIRGAAVVNPGRGSLIFPGMINLHNHPVYSMLPLWLPPSSHAQPETGRPTGAEPYGNRYQWNTAASPEYRRLVNAPQMALTEPGALNRASEVVKYGEVKAVLGGETAFQGAPASSATDNILIRNIDNQNFGRDRIEARVPSIDNAGFIAGLQNGLLRRMRNGQVDAWIPHLAEGVRDGDRPAGDSFSSRGEFQLLQSLGLLTDVTVITHGTALEPQDFAAMRSAPSARTDGAGDELGAKLVWSPLSNYLLYGKTSLVYHALQAGVTVSLGTDWSPSGSRNLLGELKIADLALRDPQLLGQYRDIVPQLSISGKSGLTLARAERALDELLVRMVTTNPAKSLRWQAEVGSIEPGKVADLVVIDRPVASPTSGLPDSPYRNLIDATEQDVRLVLVDGEPICGETRLMNSLKPGDTELVRSRRGRFLKAVDVTRGGVSKGTQTLAQITGLLEAGLNSLGGDHPPADGGPAELTNTYTYLRTNSAAAAGLTEPEFQASLIQIFGLVAGRLNLERVELTPVLVEEDDFFFHVLDARLDGSAGYLADPTPPYGRYLTNFNHTRPGSNPFRLDLFEDRWYPAP